MGQRTPNSEGPCEPLEREVVHLESQLSGLQNRLHRLLDPRRPPPEAAIRLEDEIDKLLKSIQIKQSELAACRTRHR